MRPWISVPAACTPSAGAAPPHEHRLHLGLFDAVVCALFRTHDPSSLYAVNDMNWLCILNPSRTPR